MMQLSGVFTEVLAVLPSTGGYRSPIFRHFPTFADSKSLPSSGFFKNCHPFSVPKLGIRSYKSRLRSFTVRAAATSEGDLVPVVPLQFESPTCQLLARILQMHPHLLPAVIDQQLENLQGDGDAQGEESSSLSQDLLNKVMPVNNHTVSNIAMGFDSKSEHSTGGADYYSFNIETVRYFWAL